jgi:hypothetical protein
MRAPPRQPSGHKPRGGAASMRRRACAVSGAMHSTALRALGAHSDSGHSAAATQPAVVPQPQPHSRRRYDPIRDGGAELVSWWVGWWVGCCLCNSYVTMGCVASSNKKLPFGQKSGQRAHP